MAGVNAIGPNPKSAWHRPANDEFKTDGKKVADAKMQLASSLNSLGNAVLQYAIDKAEKDEGQSAKTTDQNKKTEQNGQDPNDPSANSNEVDVTS